MLDVLDAINLVHTMEDSLALIGLKTPSCKLRAVCEIHEPNHPMPEVDTVAEVVRIVVIRLKKTEGDNVEELVNNWLKAAEEGRRGDVCKSIYRECKEENFERKLSEQVNNFSAVK